MKKVNKQTNKQTEKTYDLQPLQKQVNEILSGFFTPPQGTVDYKMKQAGDDTYTRED